VYSVRSPDLDNEERIQRSANLTFSAPPGLPGGLPGGVLHFSILAAGWAPFDRVQFHVNYVDEDLPSFIYDLPEGATAFEDLSFELPAGVSGFTFVYTYNFLSLSKEVLDSVLAQLPDRNGVVYLDDVYLVDTNEDATGE